MFGWAGGWDVGVWGCEVEGESVGGWDLLDGTGPAVGRWAGGRIDCGRQLTSQSQKINSHTLFTFEIGCSPPWELGIIVLRPYSLTPSPSLHLTILINYNENDYINNNYSRFSQT